MTPLVMGVVLVAALLHATWNALVKGAADRAVILGLVALGHVVPGCLVALIVEAPAPEAWPCIVASTVIHWAYYALLFQSYRFGDLSLVYPVSRGAAPVMIAVGAWLWAGEGLSPLAWAGIAGITGGILTLAAVRHADPRAVGGALLTAVVIAAYSLADGFGIRASGSPAGYVAWLFMAEIFVVLAILPRRWGRIRTQPLPRVTLGFCGGLISSLAYALALWAKTLAPLGMVSALRETSVIFAALIGAVWMREGHVRRRLGAAVIVAGGIALLAVA